MIELKNISTRLVVPYDSYKIQKLVEETGATSALDVEKLMDEHPWPEYYWGDVSSNFFKVEKKIESSNKKGYEPEMFYTRGYSDDILAKQDSMNYGNILLLDNPACSYSAVRYCHLKKLSIKQIKIDLSHTYADGKNFVISNNNYYKKVGRESIPKVISSIEMYEDQIERQAHLTSERDINLFELDKDVKLDIVEEMYNEIIMYLVYKTEARLVWSELTDSQKKLYLSSAINKTQKDIETKEKIKEMIANYTTLPELEKVANHNLKVLKRFIEK